MNFRKGVLLMFVALIVGGSVLYAQNSMSLATGTYSCDDLGAGHTIKIEAKFYGDYSGDISPVRNFTQYMGNTVVARGTVSPPRRGEMEVNGDYSVTWTYVNSRTFIDQGGKTWRRIGS